MKIKKEFVDLDSHMRNARRVKSVKAHKDRLLDALRDLAEATHNAPNLTDEQKKALDKASVALQYYNADTQSH